MRTKGVLYKREGQVKEKKKEKRHGHAQGGLGQGR